MGRQRSGIHLDVKSLLFEAGVSSAAFLDEICSGKKKIRLASVFDPRNPSENKAGAALQRLARARLIENQERGTDNLFLAWPFVLGQWPDSSWVRTPFQFIPVNLANDGKSWWMEIRLEAAILNPAFMLAYAHHTGKALNSELFEKELGIEAGNAAEYLTKFYELLKESGPDINFNSDLFTLRMDEFLPIRKNEFPGGFGPGVLKLQPQALLGLFSLSDSLLLPDFDWLEREGADLESLFIKDLPEAVKASEKDLLFPLPVDGSQEECLKEILSGKNLLVQGPPGTGKSQLITNLIAAATAKGKSVLLVCQKKVALEVVQRRLGDIGIGRQAALWSDFRNDLSALYAGLASQIDKLEETENRNKGLDTVMLEREYNRHSQEISRISESLENWKLALFDESIAGISYHELKSRLGEKAPEFSFPGFREFPLPEWEEFSRWADRHGTTFFQGRLLSPLLAAKAIWPSLQTEGILHELHEIQKEEEDFQSFLQDAGWSFSSAYQVPLESLQLAADFPEPDSFFYSLPAAEVLSPRFRLEWKTWSERLLFLHQYLKDWPERQELAEEEWFQIRTAQQEFRGKSSFLLKGISWFRPGLIPYRRWRQMLMGAGYADPEEALDRADEFLQLRKKNLFFEGVGFTSDRNVFTEEVLAKAFRSLTEFEWQAGFLERVLQDFPRYSIGNLAMLNDLAAKLRAFRLKRDYSLIRLSALFPDADPEQCLVSLKEGMPLWQDRSDWIRESDFLLESVPPHWQQSLLALSKRMKLPDAGELDVAWAFDWRKEIETQFPVLRYSGDWFEKEIKALQESLLKKRSLSGSFLHLKLEEETHKDLVRNRLQNRVSYRALYHQVSKKRQRLPLRKLWESHGEEILKFIPCWLATPESVSATWSMEMKFDLVVFDEASQCFAEKGIPSIARGRQVVVIGDGKQLPPSHLFSTRWEEGEEDDEAGLHFSEQNSLLDLARQFYPSKMLRGHYRSSFPELIDFSNRHFYEGNLSVIPSPSSLLPRKSAFRFVKVDGVWEAQSNLAEALWMAENAVRFFKENTGKTLGIVSFSLRQQEKIEEAIVARAMQEAVLIPDWFFVKNIENVQGDERDYIWFSVAYARNPAGKMVSQFGSLSMDGGENRLNVAISRARIGVTVLSSLYPQEWSFSAGMAAGPRLLAEYLAWAYANQTTEKISMENALGSLSLLCDEVMADEAESSLLFSDRNKLFAEKSMKAWFGLNSIYFSSLGYRISFAYWK